MGFSNFRKLALNMQTSAKENCLSICRMEKKKLDISIQNSAKECLPIQNIVQEKIAYQYSGWRKRKLRINTQNGAKENCLPI